MDILDFLAAFPDRAFTLSDIARSAKINNSSCHALLNALMTRGYLVQGPKERTYMLGPSLVAAGQAGLEGQPLLARANKMAKELAGSLGHPVLVSALVDEDVVCISSIAGSSGRKPLMHAGERMLLVPPVGMVFLAWSPEAAVEAWIEKKATNNPETPAGWRQSLDLIRKRGFQLALRSPAHGQLSGLLAELASQREVYEYKDQVFNLMASAWQNVPQPKSISPNDLYDVQFISAPIFNEKGQIMFTLGVGDFPEKLKGSVVKQYSEQLLRACLMAARPELALAAAQEAQQPAPTKKRRRA